MKNPTSFTVRTPDGKTEVEDVETWWRDGPDLIVERTNGDEDRFSLGEIID